MCVNYARGSAIGVPKNAARKATIIASSVPKHAMAVPRLAVMSREECDWSRTDQG